MAKPVTHVYSLLRQANIRVVLSRRLRNDKGTQFALANSTKVNAYDDGTVSVLGPSAAAVRRALGLRRGRPTEPVSDPSTQHLRDVKVFVAELKGVSRSARRPKTPFIRSTEERLQTSRDCSRCGLLSYPVFRYASVPPSREIVYLCMSCRNKSLPPPKRPDALGHRLPGSYGAGKRR